MTETAVKERPILFSGPMIQAILAGRKTMTRRVVKELEECRARGVVASDFEEGIIDGEFYGNNCGLPYGPFRCPFGASGDRLWVREAFTFDSTDLGEIVAYRADGAASVVGCTDGQDEICGVVDWWTVRDDTRWKPSIHMPRWASRITLEITEVRVERLQKIDESDALREGFGHCDYGVVAFHELWDVLNAKRGYSWESNPWVWVVEFKVIE